MIKIEKESEELLSMSTKVYSQLIVLGLDNEISTIESINNLNCVINTHIPRI